VPSRLLLFPVIILSRIQRPLPKSGMSICQPEAWPLGLHGALATFVQFKLCSYLQNPGIVPFISFRLSSKNSVAARTTGSDARPLCHRGEFQLELVASHPNSFT
jgi:hypothetical protein